MESMLEKVLNKPILVGKLIQLRACEESDFVQFKNMREDPNNCRFIRPVETEQKILEVFQMHRAPWQYIENRWNALIIASKDNKEFLGEIVFRLEDELHQRVELGYRINSNAAGKGICTESVQLLINYLFKELNVFKIIARCDPRNIASFKVMQKVGMQREAYFKQHYLIGDEWSDQLDYGLLKSEWLNLID